MIKKSMAKRLTGYEWFQILAPGGAFALIGVSSVLWNGMFSKAEALILVAIGCLWSYIERLKIINNLKDIQILKYRK
ncbi:MAG: hypothetical protein WC254_06250 [Candidatus Woesearchaeota archaeon]|jgi:hypothetical protein